MRSELNGRRQDWLEGQGEELEHAGLLPPLPLFGTRAIAEAAQLEAAGRR